jgi:hypothetical protein
MHQSSAIVTRIKVLLSAGHTESSIDLGLVQFMVQCKANLRPRRKVASLQSCNLTKKNLNAA